MTWREAIALSPRHQTIRITDQGLTLTRYSDGQTRVQLPDGTARHATPKERDEFLDWEPVA